MYYCSIKIKLEEIQYGTDVPVRGVPTIANIELVRFSFCYVCIDNLCFVRAPNVFISESVVFQPRLLTLFPFLRRNLKLKAIKIGNYQRNTC